MSKFPVRIRNEKVSPSVPADLAREIVRRYNEHPKLVADFKDIREKLEKAISALESARFTRCDNGNWKPQVAKSASPILDSLDAQRQLSSDLAGLILDLTGAALPYARTDEHLRQAVIKSINAALAVIEGRSA